MKLPPKPKDGKIAYFDHAATTYVDSRVVKAMEPYWEKVFANPSSIYALGREANGAVNDARRKIAEILGTLSDTIFFTSGGTESNNLAIFGLMNKIGMRGKHVVTSAVEHHSVSGVCDYLKKNGAEVTVLPVDSAGRVNPEDVKKNIRKETALVTIMFANNEIGTVQPIAEIGKEILKHRSKNKTVYPFFHSDACQAAGALDLNVEKLHVDLMSVNGGKIYGPKGAGFLYKRRGVEIEPLFHGGGQEQGLRSGTENVPGIVGLAEAFFLIQKDRKKENLRLRGLRDKMWREINKKVLKIRLNGPELGDETVRLPNNLNFSILDIEGEALLLYLDEYGICCSTGSACNSKSLQPSPILTACGLPYEYIHGSLRFSFGKRNSLTDVNRVVKYLPPIADVLRSISPVNLCEEPSKNKHAKWLKKV